jgi:hypothetical protein
MSKAEDLINLLEYAIGNIFIGFNNYTPSISIDSFARELKKYNGKLGKSESSDTYASIGKAGKKYEVFGNTNIFIAKINVSSDNLVSKSDFDLYLAAASKLQHGYPVEVKGVS